MSPKMDKLSQLQNLVNKMADDAMAEAKKPENESDLKFYIGQAVASVSIANHIIDMQGDESV